MRSQLGGSFTLAIVVLFARTNSFRLQNFGNSGSAGLRLPFLGPSLNTDFWGRPISGAFNLNTDGTGSQSGFFIPNTNIGAPSGLVGSLFNNGASLFNTATRPLLGTSIFNTGFLGGLPGFTTGSGTVLNPISAFPSPVSTTGSGVVSIGNAAVNPILPLVSASSAGEIGPSTGTIGTNSISTNSAGSFQSGIGTGSPPTFGSLTSNPSVAASNSGSFDFGEPLPEVSLSSTGAIESLTEGVEASSTSNVNADSFLSGVVSGNPSSTVVSNPSP